MNTETIRTNIDAKLDELEKQLPALPAAALRLQRTVGSRSIEAVGNAVSMIASSACNATKAISRSTKTVTGTARWVAGRTADTVTTGAKTVAGQARAQVEIASDAVATEARGLTDAAAGAVTQTMTTVADTIDAVADELSGHPAGPLATWSRDELYALAQERDLDGRSSMTKQQLVKALRA